MLVAAAATRSPTEESIRAWLGRKSWEGSYEERQRLRDGVKWLLGGWGWSPPHVMYIGGSDILPPSGAGDGAGCAGTHGGRGRGGQAQLIEHNLRLVVYIARRFENTGINIEDLISIRHHRPDQGHQYLSPGQNIKLATYASRCIEKRNSDVSAQNCSREKSEVSWTNR